MFDRDKYLVHYSGRIYSDCKELKAGKGSHGYLTVDLGGKTHLVHRLVAEEYLPNPENKPAVNHKDGNKLNNHVTNLEWVTYSENSLHSFNVLGNKPSRGRATISEEVVKIIKSLLLDKIPQHKLADFFQVKRSLIADISAGRSWTHV